MKVTEQDVGYVADLANLELNNAERQRMVTDLNSILEYMDLLNELDTSGVEPMSQVASRYGATQSVLREDELKPSLPHEEAMRNAPKRDGAFFKVPKVIER